MLKHESMEHSPILHGSVWPAQTKRNSETGAWEEVSPKNESYRFGNPELPIAKYRETIVDTAAENRVAIVAASTGAGKSTSVPQILYESGDYRNIIVTQPRIVAAREVSERVSYEMSQSSGYDMSELVGYKTANEGNLQPSNRIRFHTDGHVVAQMMNEGAITDEDILVIDEAHERNIHIDAALAMAHERNIRTLIMSATIDTARIARHCSDARGGITVPIIDVPGRVFEIEEREGGAFADEIVSFARKRLNIQAFVPGAREAQATIGRIINRVPNGYTILFLNGDQTIEEQQQCFAEYPGGKIVISTPVGQTSITIPDNDVVIDCMYERTGDYVMGMRQLLVRPASLASMEQRKGRVGRTKKGIYSRAQLEGYPPIPRDKKGNLIVERYDKPGILKTDLASLVLRLGRAGMDIERLTFLDQPRQHEVDHAKHRLVRMGAQAMDSAVLTEAGQEMAIIPLDAHYARMLAESSKYNTDVRLQMAAMLSACAVQGITTTERDMEQWRSLSNEKRSDMLVQLDVLIKTIDMNEMEFSKYNILEQRQIKAMRTFRRLCDDLGLDSEQLHAPNEDERRALLGCIISGNDGLLVSTGFERYADEHGRTRRLPRSTEIHPTEKLIIGTSFMLQHMRNNNLKSHSLIIDATAVSPRELEMHTPWRCSYENSHVFMDTNGRVMTESDLYYDGRSTRRKSYRPLEDIEGAKELLIKKLFYERAPFDGMSDETRQMYQELTHMENYLLHYSDNTNEFHHIVENMVESAHAIGKMNATDMNTLVEIMERRGLLRQLQSILPDNGPRAREILKNTPRSILVIIDDDVVEIEVGYQNNQAYITTNPHYIRFLEGVSEDLNGRAVFVRTHENQKYLPLEEAMKRYSRDSRATRRGNEEQLTAYPIDAMQLRLSPDEVSPLTANPGMAAPRVYHRR